MKKESNPVDVIETLREPERIRAVERTGLMTANAAPRLDALTKLATESLDVPTVYISLVGDETELIKSCTSATAPFAVGDEFPLDESFAEPVADSDGRWVVDDASDRALLGDHPAREHYGAEAYVGIPLKDPSGRLLGIFGAVDDEPRDWTDRDIEVLQTIATAAETELSLRSEVERRKELEERLRQEALYDSLTGLASRELLRDRLAHAIERSERTGATLSVLYLDLDDFRDVNVALGREAGDNLLVRTAEHLQSEARDQDSLGRLGRDEFALVLEDVGDRDQVAQIARRIHDTVATTVDVGESEIECRASIGYVLTNPEGEVHGIPPVDDPDRLLRMAEEAMHAAKKRNVPYVNATEAQLSN